PSFGDRRDGARPGGVGLGAGRARRGRERAAVGVAAGARPRRQQGGVRDVGSERGSDPDVPTAVAGEEAEDEQGHGDDEHPLQTLHEQPDTTEDEGEDEEQRDEGHGGLRFKGDDERRRLYPSSRPVSRSMAVTPS